MPSNPVHIPEMDGHIELPNSRSMYDYVTRSVKRPVGFAVCYPDWLRSGQDIHVSVAGPVSYFASCPTSSLQTERSATEGGRDGNASVLRRLRLRPRSRAPC